MANIKLILTIIILSFTFPINAQHLSHKTKIDLNSKPNKAETTITTKIKKDSALAGIGHFLNNKYFKEISRVEHNYTPSKYLIFKKIGTRTPLYIGEQEKILKPGLHNYRIDYTINVEPTEERIIYEDSLNSPNQLMTIKKISASVEIPANIKTKDIKHYAYTLKDNKKDLSQGKSSISLQSNKIIINYTCEKVLEPREECIIYLDFPANKSIKEKNTAQKNNRETGRTFKAGQLIENTTDQTKLKFKETNRKIINGRVIEDTGKSIRLNSLGKD